MARLSLTLLVLLFGLSIPCRAETSLRIATWNIAHLYDSYPDRYRAYARTDEDFARLKKYADHLDADIIALQEVENEAVARRVFGDGYDFIFSNRNNPQRVGFAIRKALIGHSVAKDYTPLGLNRAALRYGLDLTLNLDGQRLRLLNVHLKSFCHDKPLTSGTHHCARLYQQVTPLESWIDARVRAQDPLIVLGDFNRRFDEEGTAPNGKWMWPILSDENPPEQKLLRVTQNRHSTCWAGQYPAYIDHIILDVRSAKWLRPNSFRQVVYTDPKTLQRKLSDHCPISIDLLIREPNS
jgi:endonuclease/exonuclease/phosphatase family metal-dependent hydrolase